MTSAKAPGRLMLALAVLGVLTAAGACEGAAMTNTGASYGASESASASCDPLTTSLRARNRWPFRMGVDAKASPDDPWGSPGALRSLLRLRAAGANTIAIVAFLWQRRPDSRQVVIGSDSGDRQLIAAIRQAREVGFKVVLKPHVWVPGTWAGAIHQASRAEAHDWMLSYQRALMHLASLAQRQGVWMLALGTELRQMGGEPEWPEIIGAVRQRYHGRLTYVADGLEGVQAFAYWRSLDAVSVSAYPALEKNPESRDREISAWIARLRDLTEPIGKPVWIAELGMRSARHALSHPWESPEQRADSVDLEVQDDALAAWLRELGKLGSTWLQGVLLWCWYSDPRAGGTRDSDFTVQNKPAQSLLLPAGLPCWQGRVVAPSNVWPEGHRSTGKVSLVR